MKNTVGVFLPPLDRIPLSHHIRYRDDNTYWALLIRREWNNRERSRCCDLYRSLSEGCVWTAPARLKGETMKAEILILMLFWQLLWPVWLTLQGCSLAAGLRGNGERMRKWRGNGERMSKWRGNRESKRKWIHMGPEDLSNKKDTHHFFQAKLSEIAKRFQKCKS